MATSQSDPFYSAKRRLGRAKKHILDLKEAMSAFMDSHPYTVVVEPDTDGVTKLHKVKLVKPFPEDMSDIACDALDSMRSSLDHAAYGAAVAGGVASPQYAYFPFSNSPEKWADRAKGLCKDIHADITALFCSFKPYKGGNDPLWALNDIRGSNQHALLAPLGTASVHVSLKEMTMVAPKDGSVTFTAPLWTPSSWDSSKNEMILAKVDPGGTLKYQFELTPFIAFGDVPCFAGEPVGGVLKHLFGVVQSILMATEAECRRLGFVP